MALRLQRLLSKSLLAYKFFQLGLQNFISGIQIVRYWSPEIVVKYRTVSKLVAEITKRFIFLICLVSDISTE